MAVVSKFLDDAINKYEQLGYSKLKLSQGIVGTCLCAYVLHFTYPLIKNQFVKQQERLVESRADKTPDNNNTTTKKCRQNKERLGGSSDEEDDLDTKNDQALEVKKKIEEAEALLANAMRKPNHIGINRAFGVQLSKMLRIMVPRFWSSEVGLLGVHTLCLVSRTFLSIYVASMEGAIVKFIVRKDVKNFLIMLLKWFGIAIPATFVNSMIRYLECKLALAFRYVLVFCKVDKINYLYSILQNSR